MTTYTLNDFFEDVKTLTMYHDTCNCDDNGMGSTADAVVYPKNLGRILERIDPLWFTNVKPNLTP